METGSITAITKVAVARFYVHALRKVWLWAIAATMLVLAAVVHHTRTTGDRVTAPIAQATPTHRRWRLATSAELSTVALFTSHILVRHAQTQDREVPFSPPGWNVLPSAPVRTREAARTLADEISREARRRPEGFAELARARSEDVVTASHGGRLGTLSASQLRSYAHVLDVLAQLAPGSVSEPIETAFGFHVFRRDPVPLEQRFAGRHLVIGHDDAPWLDYRRRAPHRIARTREQALTIATQLRGSLETRASAERDALFVAQIEQHSEHRDARQAGDMGVWSNREPSPIRWQLDALGALAEGEISAPIDTPLGIELVQRLPDNPRERLAMLAIKRAFNPDAAAADPHSCSSVSQALRAELRQLRGDPARFEALQRAHCCVGVESWSEGRGNPDVTAALKRVAVEALVDDVIVEDQMVVIAKRVAPIDTPALRFELPAPLAPDIERLIVHGRASVLAPIVRNLPSVLGRSVEIPAEHVDAFVRIHDDLSLAIEKGPEAERAAQLRTSQDALRRLLGAARFGQYMHAVEGLAADYLLR